ncbi:MAG TPA: DUF692 domain-containing protein [Polyangiaceae bacterium]
MPEKPSTTRLSGVGLGLRWDFLDEILEAPPSGLAFLEVSPENYMRRGGYYPEALERLKERYPLVTHGLTLSLGAAAPPERAYMRELRREIERLGSPWHSDHLCFSSAGPRQLHELLPLKFSEENARRVAERLEHVQDSVGVPMALENISAYARAGRAEMPEHEFICRILERSSAKLLLDVNNVYVNARNFGFDARAFIAALPLERVIEIHVAGHGTRKSGLLIDTHGTPVSSPVIELLEWTVERTGPVPVLLERDNDVPPLSELLIEVEELERAYLRALERYEDHHATGA